MFLSFISYINTALFGEALIFRFQTGERVEVIEIEYGYVVPKSKKQDVRLRKLLGQANLAPNTAARDAKFSEYHKLANQLKKVA